MHDEITHPFPNFNGCTVEVWESISNFIPHFTGHVITYIHAEIKAMLVKGPHWSYTKWAHLSWGFKLYVCKWCSSVSLHTYTINRPISQIPQCTCPISHNGPFEREMYTFLSWMLQSKIWNRTGVAGFLNLVYESISIAYATAITRKEHKLIYIIWTLKGPSTSPSSWWDLISVVTVL